MKPQFVDADGVLYDLEKVKFFRPPIVRSAVDGSRVLDGEDNEEPSKTVQSEESSCNLNAMVKRWLKGAPVPEFTPGQFGDVSSIGDYKSVQDKILAAGELFMQLSPEVRLRFNNDAVEFLDFVADPSKVAEGIELGLYAAPEEPAGGPGGGEPPATPVV